LPAGAAWFGCVDTIQLNEEEMGQRATIPWATAAGALARGCHDAVCHAR